MKGKREGEGKRTANKSTTREAGEKKSIREETDLEGNPCKLDYPYSIAFLGVNMRFGNKVLTLT